MHPKSVLKLYNEKRNWMKRWKRKCTVRSYFTLQAFFFVLNQNSFFIILYIIFVVVLEILNREEAPSKQIISYVMHMLSQEEEMDGLPPGGGLVAK